MSLSPQHDYPSPRERVLLAARHILEHGDLGALTVNALVKELRMSKSSLYKAFARKEDIVIALVVEDCHAILTRLRDELDPACRKTSAAGWVQALAHQADRTPRAILLNVRSLPTVCRDEINMLRDAQVTALANILEQAKLETRDHRLLATGLLAGVEGVMLAAARTQTPPTSRARAVEDWTSTVFPPSLLGTET